MKSKGKLNIPTKAAPKAAASQPATAPATTSGKPPSVMIAVPAMEMVNAEFAQHLAMAAANMVANGIRINCAFNIGSVITIARRNLTDIFLKSDFDYIWWVDSDMKFPIDSPVRLLKRNKDIVGVNYRRRRFPNANFTGMMGKPGAYTEFQTTDTSPPLELIDVLPHGCVMVKRSVYEKIPQPHYLQEYVPELNLEIGEDIFFCQQAQKAGYEIWCDQELSREVAHIGIFHFNYNLSVQK
jgi:phage gp46-like protein